MRPPPFAYADPRSVDDAVALLARHGDDAKVLAGGQSLVPLLNFRMARPTCLVDINRLTELDFIRPHGRSGLAIGALTRHRTVETSNLVRQRCPLLHEAIAHVAHVAIRNRGTLGGSLAHADPAAELPAVVSALGATLKVRSGRGERSLGPEEFFLGQLTTALEPDELLVSVTIPDWPAGTGSAWCEFARRQGDYGLVGVGAVLSLDGAGRVARVGLALMNVGPVPFAASAIASPLLEGGPPDEARIRAVADAVAAAVDPPSDLQAPADYRRHLAGVLTRRALTEAARRAAASAGVG
jgi:aerobic carbon-monoxide dehydrogenase medium subunit